MRNMLRFVLLISLILCPLVICKRKQKKEKDASESDFGGKLISELRDDANIDLSADEEYEDLRAELLAYHTALASLTNTRRSMKSTPCWKIGGVCIPHKMCEGHRFLSEVAGCRDKLEVCCFTWNKYQVRDMNNKGVGLVLAMPWGQSQVFGGKGVVGPGDDEPPKNKKKKPAESDEDLYADLLLDKSQENEPSIDKKKNPVVEVEDLYPDEDTSQENTPVVLVLHHKKKT